LAHIIDYESIAVNWGVLVTSILLDLIFLLSWVFQGTRSLRYGPLLMAEMYSLAGKLHLQAVNRELNLFLLIPHAGQLNFKLVP